MASPGSQAASRTDPGSRASNSSSGKSSGSGSGAYNGQGRPNVPSVAQIAAGPTGLRGPTDASGTLAGNTTSVLGAGGPYQGAVADYGNKGWLGRQLNVTPDPSRPATYANGISHFGMNIPGALLGTAASAFLPGAGIPVGMGAGALFRALGIPDTVFGSGSPSPTQPGQGFDYSPGGAQGRFGPGTQQAAAPGLGNPTQGSQQPSAQDHLQQLAALNSQIPGNLGAPVNSGTAPGAPVTGMGYLQRMGRLQSVTPGYGVPLPSYQYSGRATV